MTTTKKMMMFVASLILLVLIYSVGYRTGFKSRTVLDTSLILSLAKHQAICIEAGDEMCIDKSNEMIINTTNAISENWPKEALEMNFFETREPNN